MFFMMILPFGLGFCGFGSLGELALPFFAERIGKFAPGRFLQRAPPRRVFHWGIFN
jgi:hypothetical protein